MRRFLSFSLPAPPCVTVSCEGLCTKDCVYKERMSDCVYKRLCTVPCWRSHTACFPGDAQVWVIPSRERR